jgi:hypothetical protein
MPPDDVEPVFDEPQGFVEPDGDGTGVIPAWTHDPHLMSLTFDGTRILIGFQSREIPDESRVAAFRVQLQKYCADTKCKRLKFDLAGIKILPSRMLGFLVTLKNEGHEVELVNVCPMVHDILRLTRLASMFTM